MSDAATDITTHPIHLGLGATAEIEPEFTGEMSWYAGYVDRHATDGEDGANPRDVPLDAGGTFYFAVKDGIARAGDLETAATHNAKRPIVIPGKERPLAAAAGIDIG